MLLCVLSFLDLLLDDHGFFDFACFHKDTVWLNRLVDDNLNIIHLVKVCFFPAWNNFKRELLDFLIDHLHYFGINFFKFCLEFLFFDGLKLKRIHATRCLFNKLRDTCFGVKHLFVSLLLTLVVDIDELLDTLLFFNDKIKTGWCLIMHPQDLLQVILSSSKIWNSCVDWQTCSSCTSVKCAQIGRIKFKCLFAC